MCKACLLLSVTFLFDICSLYYKDYQGRESRVVIISCVRSNPRFLEEDVRKGLGFVFERKRYDSINSYFQAKGHGILIVL